MASRSIIPRGAFTATRAAPRPPARPESRWGERPASGIVSRAEVARVNVGVGELAVVSVPSMLVTYGLGSCVAVCVVDASAGIGGLLHFMLPNREVGHRQDDGRPGVFADTGIRVLLEQMVARGAARTRMRVKLVGGAAISSAVRMDIGKQNVLAARRMLWSERLPVDAQDVGGGIARTVRMDAPQGRLRIQSPGIEERFL